MEQENIEKGRKWDGLKWYLILVLFLLTVFIIANFVFNLTYIPWLISLINEEECLELPYVTQRMIDLNNWPVKGWGWVLTLFGFSAVSVLCLFIWPGDPLVLKISSIIFIIGIVLWLAIIAFTMWLPMYASQGVPC